MDNPQYGIDATNAGLFSEAAYHLDGTGESQLTGWAEVADASQETSIDRIRVFVNNTADEVVLAFKGTDNITNILLSVADSGQAEYNNFHSYIETAYNKATVEYSGYKFFVDGHSLGGGMAQDFALETGLDGFGQNALPITNGTVSAISAYRQQNTFIETNVAGDIATWYFSHYKNEPYLDATPTELPSIYQSFEAAGAPAVDSQSDINIAVAFVNGIKAHELTTFNSLVSQYSLGADGHVYVPGYSNAPSNLAIWMLQGFADIESFTDNGDGTYSLADMWDDKFQISESGTETGPTQSVTYSVSASVAGSNPQLIWSGTETSTLTNADISNPVYNVSLNASSNSAYVQPESATYIYGADGSFSGQYTPQDTFNWDAYAFSFDASTGTLIGSGWNDDSSGFTYLADGSGSGSRGDGSETFKFSISDGGVATWDTFVNTGSYTYSDNYITTSAGGYEEDYSDSYGSSWVYAQDADGVETV